LGINYTDTINLSVSNFTNNNTSEPS